MVKVLINKACKFPFRDGEEIMFLISFDDEEITFKVLDRLETLYDNGEIYLASWDKKSIDLCLLTEDEIKSDNKKVELFGTQKDQKNRILRAIRKYDRNIEIVEKVDLT